mmetsp:Transcript_10408/g.29656  ORF Transcript_10408/g.29656 Transcript_10408/m.29656 type:complete len:348 (+) Transcript_10408:1487-2530(+)
MTDNDRSDIRQRVEVGLDPGHVDDIQVICGLIQEEDISLLKHGTRQGKFHAPSSTQSRHGVIGLGLSVQSKSDSGKNRTDLVLGDSHCLEFRVSSNVLHTRKVGLFSLNIGLNKHSTNLGHIRETFNLVIGNRSHESGLSTIIGSKKTVSVSSEKLHLGVVEKNLGTIGESKHTVAQFLGIFVVVLFVGDLQHFFSLFTDNLNVLLSLILGIVWLHEGEDVLFPLKILHEMQVHHRCGNYTRILDGGQLRFFRISCVESLLEFCLQLGDISTDRHSLVGQSLEAVQLFHSTLRNFTSFRISDTGCVGFQGRKQQRKERSSADRIIDKLTHVVNDNSSLTLGSSRFFF